MPYPPSSPCLALPAPSIASGLLQSSASLLAPPTHPPARAPTLQRLPQLPLSQLWSSMPLILCKQRRRQKQAADRRRLPDVHCTAASAALYLTAAHGKPSAVAAAALAAPCCPTAGVTAAPCTCCKAPHHVTPVSLSMHHHAPHAWASRLGKEQWAHVASMAHVAHASLCVGQLHDGAAAPAGPLAAAAMVHHTSSNTVAAASMHLTHDAFQHLQMTIQGCRRLLGGGSCCSQAWPSAGWLCHSGTVHSGWPTVRTPRSLPRRLRFGCCMLCSPRRGATPGAFVPLPAKTPLPLWAGWRCTKVGGG